MPGYFFLKNVLTVHGPMNSEQQQLAGLAAGERVVTNQIYRQYYPVVSGWLVKNGSTAVDAADLFQEAMVVLFGKAQDKDFRLTCSMGTYLMAVSKHLWYKKKEKQSRNPVLLKEDIGLDEDDEGLGFSDDVKVHEEREAHYEQLDAALEMIGEPCR